MKPHIIDEAAVRALIPKRSAHPHKWEVGGLLIVAGGPGYIGAAALTSMAAARAGAGIVNLALPRSAMSAVATLVPEVVFVPLADGMSDSPGKRSTDVIFDKLERSQAMLVGPGLGEDEYAAGLLGEIFGLTEAKRARDIGFRGAQSQSGVSDEKRRTLLSERPIVVDADGLNWLAKQSDWADRLADCKLILTPHVGEMSRLTGLDSAEITSSAANVAAKYARQWRQSVVLKGSPTVIASGDYLLQTPDSPPSLAKAGTGDVFAGTIAALLAQGLQPIDAAAVAGFVGCRAARAIEQRVGTLGLIASDLPLAIAEELGRLENNGGEKRE